MIYTLGGGGQYYHRWAGATKEVQDEWRAIIIVADDAVRDIVGSCEY
jgi:hypothetical protein